jgi:hypothetical protein
MTGSAVQLHVLLLSESCAMIMLARLQPNVRPAEDAAKDTRRFRERLQSRVFEFKSSCFLCEILFRTKSYVGLFTVGDAPFRLRTGGGVQHQHQLVT